MELIAGSKLGSFTIIRQIGVGGMSEVYLVSDNLDRHFALKTMSAQLSKDPEFCKRFELEAKIMASLTHPNIIQLHSFFEDQGYFCLVIEYVDGHSLKELIEQTGPIPQERALNILRQIAQALSYAHDKGIIHRDVKPSNILIDKHDNVKVMDFGIARITEGSGLTRTGSQMGTLVYMSPEQVRDSKKVDQKTDSYSLGVTFYEMLTGKPPYDEKSVSYYNICQNIVYNPLPNPRAIYPHITDEIISLLKGLTKKEPEERLSMLHILAESIPKRQIPPIQVKSEVDIKSHRKLQIGSLKIANRGKVVFLSSLFCPFRSPKIANRSLKIANGSPIITNKESPKIANRSLKIANWILGRALTDIIPA